MLLMLVQITGLDAVNILFLNQYIYKIKIERVNPEEFHPIIEEMYIYYNN